MKRTLENLRTLLGEMMVIERKTEDQYREQGNFDLAEAHKRIRWAYDDVITLISEDPHYFNILWNKLVERNEDESH